MGYIETRDGLLNAIANPAMSAADKFTTAQALSEFVSSKKVEKDAFVGRLNDAETKYNGNTGAEIKHLPIEINTTHQIYSKNPQRNDFVFVAQSNTYRNIHVSDDRGRTWYTVEFDSAIAYNSWNFDFTINPTNNTFRVFYMNANIIYASDEISMTDLKANKSYKITPTTTTAISQNGTKQEFFVAERHVDGHLFVAFTEHDGSYYNTYFTQLRDGQMLWDAVALLKSNDATYNDNIATNIVSNKAGDKMYFFGSNMTNSAAGAIWTFEIIFNPTNGSGAFEIGRFYTYTKGTAPYYLYFRSHAVLVNEGTANQRLYVLPAYTTNTVQFPMYITISAFNSYIVWANSNTDVNFSSFQLHTYGQYIMPNEKFISQRRWTTQDEGRNMRCGWNNYSSCNDQYSVWKGGCYTSISTSERPYQLNDMFTEFRGDD